VDLDRDGVEARSVKLCAIGDVALSGAVATAIRTDGPGTALDGLRGVLAGADCVFANLESPFVPAETPADGWDRAALVAGLDLAPALAGIDVCNLAANHVLDGGARGLEATRAVLDRLGAPSHFTARQVRPEDLTRFDHVLAMDRANLRDLRQLAPGRVNVHLMLEPTTGGDVPDPYTGGPRDFEHVRQLLDDAVVAWLARWED